MQKNNLCVCNYSYFYDDVAVTKIGAIVITVVS